VVTLDWRRGIELAGNVLDGPVETFAEQPVVRREAELLTWCHES
jgi:hypothetical protein